MAVGSALYAATAGLAVLARGMGQDNDPALLATAIYSLAAVVVLMVLRARVPLWLLQTQTLIVVCLTGLLVAIAPNALSAANMSFRYIAVALYVAFWMSLRMTLTVAALITVSSLVACAANSQDLRPLLPTWLLVSVLTWVVALIVHHLSRAAARHATVDPLTGMLNRGGLRMLLDLSVGPGRVIVPRTLVVIDLDDFKQLNDTRGHLAGDQALSDLGTAWRRTLRADDIAVRSGGDEFILILPSTTRENAEVLMARLRAESPVPWSFGIADWPATEAFDEASARADRELYRRKAERERGPAA